MFAINIWGQQTALSGQAVSDHADDCRSDDHLHLEFETIADAIAYAKAQGDRVGADGGYRRRMATAIRAAIENSN